jgi:putative ABC transport system substrate-binding protein
MRSAAFALVLVFLIVGARPAAEAQQSGKVYRLGFLSPAAPPAPSDTGFVTTLVPMALRELGYIESENLIIERRYAEGKLQRLSALARELVDARVDVIVAVALSALRAAKVATPTIPIVMGFGPPDPVAFGFVKSLASPGGNITGVTYWAQRGYEAKRLELLKEAIPRAARIAFLASAGAPSQTFVQEAQTAAVALGVTLGVVEVQANDYDLAFASMLAGRAEAVLVQGAPTFNRDRKRIIALAAKHRLPAIYEWRHHVEEDGGLMAYGGNLFDLSRRVAWYIDRIFKGTKPADLPIEQPTKLELWSMSRLPRHLASLFRDRYCCGPIMLSSEGFRQLRNESERRTLGCRRRPSAAPDPRR